MRGAKIAVYTALYIVTLFLAASSFLLHAHTITSIWFILVRALIVFFATVLLTKYTLYMFISPWFHVMGKREQVLVDHFVQQYHPYVSVLIPAWNEEVGILHTVKSLLKSTYKHMEIIIVNDGSTDGSDRLIRRFIEKYERELDGVHEAIKLVYWYQENGGKGAALNTALKLAKGDLLLSIDADCHVHEYAVEAYVNAFRNPAVMAAVGNVKIGNAKTLVGTVQELEFLLSFYFKRADSLLNTIYIIGGAAGAFRKEVFQQLGGYSTKNITEDIELSVRIQEAGMRIVYCPDAIVYTEGASTLYGLMKQRLRWKRGRFQTFWEHRRLFFSLKPQHNKLLTWLVLPLAIFGDVQLGFEPIFILVLYIFSFLTGDMSAFFSGIIVVALMFAIQWWESREQGSYLLLAPIGWLLFYLCTFVEIYALIQSIWLSLRKKEASWQRWARSGALD